jgi:hypothetical protein
VRQKEDCQKRPVVPSPVSTTQQDEEEQYPPYGTIQPRRMMAPDKTQPNVLNEAMAKEAAIKYEQKQSKIQQAVAELATKKKQQQTKSSLDHADDNDDPTEDPTETDGTDDVVVVARRHKNEYNKQAFCSVVCGRSIDQSSDCGPQKPSLRFAFEP